MCREVRFRLSTCSLGGSLSGIVVPCYSRTAIACVSGTVVPCVLGTLSGTTFFCVSGTVVPCHTETMPTWTGRRGTVPGTLTFSTLEVTDNDTLSPLSATNRLMPFFNSSIVGTTAGGMWSQILHLTPWSRHGTQTWMLYGWIQAIISWLQLWPVGICGHQTNCSPQNPQKCRIYNPRLPFLLWATI
jgi:hypothetical protein